MLQKLQLCLQRNENIPNGENQPFLLVFLECDYYGKHNSCHMRLVSVALGVTFETYYLSKDAMITLS